MSLRLICRVLVVGSVVAGLSCNLLNNTDINPHVEGLGNIRGPNASYCCAQCMSPEWQAKGCMFFTYSKAKCWFKSNANIKVASPGKMSGQIVGFPPPPPGAKAEGCCGVTDTVGDCNIHAS